MVLVELQFPLHQVPGPEQQFLAEMGADEIVRYATTHYGAKWRLTVSAIHAAATHLKSMRLAESLKWNTLERQR